MRIMTFLAVAVFSAIPVVAAGPATQRTFVSAASGSDANACSRLSPCRNFAAAIAATSPGGEVIVLDSAAMAPS